MLQTFEFLSITQRLNDLSEKIKFKCNSPRKIGLGCNSDNLIELVFYNGITSYNQILVDIRGCDSVAKFRNQKYNVVFNKI